MQVVPLSSEWPKAIVNMCPLAGQPYRTLCVMANEACIMLEVSLSCKLHARNCERKCGPWALSKTLKKKLWCTLGQAHLRARSVREHRRLDLEDVTGHLWYISACGERMSWGSRWLT